MTGGLLIFAGSSITDVSRRRFGGLTTLERHIRTMVRAGVERLLIALPDDVEPELGRLTRCLDVTLEFVRRDQTPQMTFAADDRVLILLGDHVHHHSSLSALVRQDNGSRLLVQVTPAPDQTVAFHGIQVTADGLVTTAAHARDESVSTGAFLCTGDLAPQELISSGQAPLAFLASRCSGRDTATIDGDVLLWRRARRRVRRSPCSLAR